jgi:hypothetical protein
VVAESRAKRFAVKRPVGCVHDDFAVAAIRRDDHRACPSMHGATLVVVAGAGREVREMDVDSRLGAEKRDEGVLPRRLDHGAALAVAANGLRDEAASEGGRQRAEVVLDDVDEVAAHVQADRARLLPVAPRADHYLVVTASDLFHHQVEIAEHP